MEIKKRYEEIRERIEKACSRSKRDPREITIIGVTKSQPVEAITGSINAGIINIGESYIQEALPKIEALKDQRIIWHFIGRLQTNKIKFFKNYFDYVHSVDNERQIDELNKRIDKKIGLFIEVNTGEEVSKGGTSYGSTIKLFEKIIKTNEEKQKNKKPVFDLMGLMCLPPFNEDVETSRSHFVNLRECLGKINTALGLNMEKLSMGMSNDFDIAVEEGATHVRIGTLLYGERDKNV